MRSLDSHRASAPIVRRITHIVGILAIVASVACVVNGIQVAAATTPRGTPPGGCVERPHCSFGYGWEDAGNKLQQQLGCGPVYQYKNGFESGVTGGNGSFCPDTVDTRAVLHAQGRRGYGPGYCETCLGVPDGQLFVLWMETIGPSCPSGCTPGNPPPPF